MSFTLAKIKTLTDTVEIETPLDFGKSTKGDIDVTFKVLEAEEFVELTSGDADEDMPSRDQVADALHDNIVSIDGLKDENGNDVEFSRDVLDMMLCQTHIRVALYKAFVNIQVGGKADIEGRRKNSSARGRTGRRAK